MTEAAAPAVELALALLRTPARVAACRDRPLLHDVLPLIRIAAGDREMTAAAAAATGQPVATVAEAAVFFIQQVLFAPDSDSYRVLGVNPSWPAERIKEHHRWLVRWLHPDRNPDEWTVVFADRINGAWQDLRLPERRRAYDRQLALASAAPGARRATAPVDAPAADAAWSTSGERVLAPPPRLSARTVRRLPAMVLGGFTIFAGSALGLTYYLRSLDESIATPRSDDVAVAVVPRPPPAGARTPSPALPAAKAPPLPGASATRPTPPATGAARLAGGPRVAAEANDPGGGASRRPSAEGAMPVAANDPRSAPAAAVARPPSAPMPTEASTASVPVTSPPVAAAEKEPATPLVVLERFRQAFANGDMVAFRNLLARDGGRPVARLVRDYGKVFERTTARRIDLGALVWRRVDDGLIGSGQYDAWLSEEGGGVRHEVGAIRFHLLSQDGQWRIYRVDNEALPDE